jgi:hypothetical protein
MRPKDTHHFTLLLIMTIEVLAALLAKGQTGNQILDILDSIADGGSADDCTQNAPTLEEINF